MTKLYRTLVAVFFLLLFTGSKASSFHNLAHDHDDNIVQCELCITVLTNQFSPLTSETSDTFNIISFTLLVNKTTPVLVATLYSPTEYSALYGRPPPRVH